MALTATLSTLEIGLSDVDRGVYEELTLKVARHPSESAEYLWTRVLAYCLEYTEGIAFSRGGLSDPDDPAITVRDLTGALRAWIEVGAPDAARLHKASKASPRVALYTHKEPRLLLRGYDGARIHRADAIDIVAIPRPLLAELEERLDRRVAFTLLVNDGELHLDFAGQAITGSLERLRLPPSP
ncbi:MAG: YaeQ family protein [Gemmatimonadales bacterium]|nr:YaeQ family protein [Gemmatimonadota bacterium]MCL4212773.1 YaeQ family protein [Gemmatimonadales bacterium]